MVTENLIGLLDEFQKFMVKVKIQQILDMLVKDDRVHETSSLEAIAYSKQLLSLISLTL